MINKTLIHYTILDKLGAGGMGEVYRAEDTKLGRQVAIKVLPEPFAHDAERMARFEREARTLALLNHPNIAAIYGLEEAEGKRFLAMELVEGEGLEQKLAKGAMPLEEAIEVCLQIAEGMEAAHEKGIIHRDLKPSNIKVSPEGKVKVLDFGLAKALYEEKTGPVLMDSPTLTDQMTEPGIILGTAPYMSPEQAKGRPVDTRTDIWAFGCILYECLTGERAFPGESVSETVAAILKGEPNWGILPHATSIHVSKLVRRCLEKDPRKRLQAIGDARIELSDEKSEGGRSGEDILARTPRLARSRRLTPIFGLVAAAGWIVAALTILKPGSSVSRDSLVTFPVDLPREQQIYNKIDRPMVVFSRDGRRLAWIGDGSNSPVICTRTLDDPEVRVLEDSQGCDPTILAISPDGRWFAFQKAGTLLKMSVEGGAATPLVDTATLGSNIAGLDWGDGDRIVVTANNSLLLFDLKGGAPVQLTECNKESKEILHYNPRFVPGGRAVIFANNLANWNTYRLEAVSLDTKKRTEVADDAYAGFVTEDGHLLFGRDGNIFAVPLDLADFRTTGQEVPVLSSVQMQSYGRIPMFAISPNGNMAYIPDGQGILLRRFEWIDRNGQREAVPEPPRDYFMPDLSHDGRQMVLGIQKGHRNTLQTYNFERAIFTPRTDDTISSGIWNGTGDRLIFSSYADGPTNLYMMPIGGRAERLTESPNQQFPWSWSLDGRLLAYTQWDDESYDYDIWLMLLDGQDRNPLPFMTTDADEYQPCISPNGRCIAYTLKGKDDPEIYVQEIHSDGSKKGGPYKVSRAGGREPKWSPTGKELFYRSLDDANLLGVDFDPENSTVISGEKTILDKVVFPKSDAYGEYRYYDVAPGGQKFLVLQEDMPERARMIIVVNWLDELNRKISKAK